MSVKSVRCPSCNTPVDCLDDGSPPRFCTQCTARIPAGAAANPPDVAPATGVPAGAAVAADFVADPVAGAADRAAVAFSVPHANVDFAMDDAPEGLRPVPPDLARRWGIGEASEPAPAPAPEAPSVESYCEDLDIRFNRSRVFIEGAKMRFEFDFKFKSDLQSDLVVDVTDAESKRHIHKGTVVPVRGMLRPYMFSYRPDFHGTPALLLRVGYRRDDRPYWFEANFTCRVYAPLANAREVIHNVTFQLEADRGSVIECGDALSYLNNLRQNVSAEDPLQKLIDAIDGTPKAMVPLALYPSSHDEDDEDEGDRTLPAIPPGGDVDSLTLAIAGWKLHLLSDTRVQMGRNKQNDFMARIFDPDGVARKERNAQISKFHARLELHGDRCFVVDRALDMDTNAEKSSACGVYVNDRRIPAGRSTELPVNIRTRIGLGDRCGPGSAAFEMDLHPWTCGMMVGGDCPLESRCPPGAPSCAFIRRADAVREVFAVVWRCCPLGLAVPEAGDLRVWRQDGGFAWRRGAHKGWLVPGQALHANGGPEIGVKSYRQFGK